MSKLLSPGFAAIVMIYSVICGSALATGYKTTELNRKMSEITSLQQSLSGKIELAKEKKKQLEQKTEALKEEIKHKTAQLDIKSYNKAILTPRIDYNLKLIQLLRGYVASLNEKIIYFQNGHETLGYYFQQAQDDLLMIKTLNDLEVEKLIAQINLVLDKYTPETSKPLFDAESVALEDTEKIWNEIAD